MCVLTALASSSTSRQCEQCRGWRLEDLRDGDLCDGDGVCVCTTPPRGRTHWDDDVALALCANCEFDTTHCACCQRCRGSLRREGSSKTIMCSCNRLQSPASAAAPSAAGVHGVARSEPNAQAANVSAPASSSVPVGEDSAHSAAAPCSAPSNMASAVPPVALPPAPKPTPANPVVFVVANPPAWTSFTSREAQAAFDAVVARVGGKTNIAINPDDLRLRAFNSKGGAVVQKALVIKKADARPKKKPSEWVSIKNFRCCLPGSKVPLVCLALQMQRQAHAGAIPTLAWRVRVQVQPSVFTAAGILFPRHVNFAMLFPPDRLSTIILVFICLVFIHIV